MTLWGRLAAIGASKTGRSRGWMRPSSPASRVPARSPSTQGAPQVPRGLSSHPVEHGRRLVEMDDTSTNTK